MAFPRRCKGGEGGTRRRRLKGELPTFLDLSVWCNHPKERIKISQIPPYKKFCDLCMGVLNNQAK